MCNSRPENDVFQYEFEADQMDNHQLKSSCGPFGTRCGFDHSDAPRCDDCGEIIATWCIHVRWNTPCPHGDRRTNHPEYGKCIAESALA